MLYIQAVLHGGRFNWQHVSVPHLAQRIEVVPHLRLEEHYPDEILQWQLILVGCWSEESGGLQYLHSWEVESDLVHFKLDQLFSF